MRNEIYIMFLAPVKSACLILDTDSFTKLTQLAEEGRVSELSCFIKDALREKENSENKLVEVKSQPFLEPAIVKSPPVVLAARNGHQPVVEFLLRTFLTSSVTVANKSGVIQLHSMKQPVGVI